VAIVFELVVSFGVDAQPAVDAAAKAVRRVDHLELRGVPVPLSGPFISEAGEPDAYIEFSVAADGLGYGERRPKPAFDPRSLTEEEMSKVGRALYDLLGEFSGYRAAIVGWDPESLVDVNDYETEWRNGEPLGYDGLVLADDLCARWGLGPEWVAFRDGYRWLPYSGSRRGRAAPSGDRA
jgi:hypothetical protein